MPVPTPKQKIEQVRMFGGDAIEIRLEGDTYDDAYTAALHYQQDENAIFVHPFDDIDVIEGQATIGLEILSQSEQPLTIFVPVGGGGLISGILTVFKARSPLRLLVLSLKAPLLCKPPYVISTIPGCKIDKFVDEAAVQRLGDICFGV